MNSAITLVDLIVLTATFNHRQVSNAKFYYIPLVLPKAIQQINKDW